MKKSKKEKTKKNKKKTIKMIKKTTPLTLAEVKSLVEKDKEKHKELLSFIKKFNKRSINETEKIKKELQGLDIIKLNLEHIVKIINFMPEDAADLRMLLPDISLDEDEISKILSVIK